MQIAKEGGSIAGDTRKTIEQRTGEPIITSKNAFELNKVVTDLIEGVAEEINDEKSNWMYVLRKLFPKEVLIWYT